MSIQTRSRVMAGAAGGRGGQFAPEIHSEPDVRLDPLSAAPIEQETNPHDWPEEISFDELRSMFNDYDSLADTYRDPDLAHARFRFVPEHPTEGYPGMSPAEYVGEIDYDDNAEAEDDLATYEALQDDIATDPASIDPVIIDPDQDMALDGNHRLGLAADAGVGTLPAYVRIP